MDNLASMMSDEVSDSLNLEENDLSNNLDSRIPDIVDDVSEEEQNDNNGQDFADELLESDIGRDCMDCEENDNCLKDDISQDAMNDSPTPQVELDIQLLSLKQNCLNHIINNFEIFNNAFVNLSSEETLLCRNLTYLQRVFTFDIITGLNKKKLLKDQYLTFLINGHLKKLDVRQFKVNNCSLEAVEKRIHVVGHGLEEVSLCSLHYFSNIKDLLSNLPNVEVLWFVDCDDEVLESISFYCSKLRELYINEECCVSQKGVKQLCQINCCQTECLIKVLSLEKLDLTSDTIMHLLHNMPFLEVLECRNLAYTLYSMHKEDLKNNTLKNIKKYNLTKFDVNCVNIPEMSDVLKVWTEVCPNIKTIRINVSISEIKFDLFSLFSNLETLVVLDYVVGYVRSIIQTHRHSNNFNTFLKSYLISKSSNLRNLEIPNFAISVFDLIESCPKLESLSLVNVDFQSLESISEKQNITLKNLNKLILKDLKFWKQFVTESVIEILLCSPSLNYVFFKDCEFENSNITTELQKYYEDFTVEFFVFQSCDIRLDMLQSIISNCSTLKSLKIDTCKNISPKDVFSLKKLRNFTNSFADIVFSIYEEVEDDDDDWDFGYDYSSDMDDDWGYDYISDSDF